MLIVSVFLDRQRSNTFSSFIPHENKFNLVFPLMMSMVILHSEVISISDSKRRVHVQNHIVNNFLPCTVFIVFLSSNFLGKCCTHYKRLFFLKVTHFTHFSDWPAHYPNHNHNNHNNDNYHARTNASWPRWVVRFLKVFKTSTLKNE